MARAYIESASKVLDRRDLDLAVSQCSKCACDQFGCRFRCLGIKRFAAKTSAKTSNLRIIWRDKKGNILAFRLPLAARRPAKPTGRPDTEIKYTVKITIFCRHRVPLPISKFL